MEDTGDQIDRLCDKHFDIANQIKSRIVEIRSIREQQKALKLQLEPPEPAGTEEPGLSPQAPRHQRPVGGPR